MPPMSRFLKHGLVVGSLLIAGLQAHAAPTVSLAASPNPVGNGNTFALNVNAAGFTDLYAWQLSVSFDPRLFQAVGSAEGGFLAGAGSTFYGAGTIDNAAGTVSFAFDTLLSAVPGALGGGLLETVTFRSVATGTGSFTLGDVLFLDSSFNDLAPATSSVSVSAVPEPAAATLLLGGLALLGLQARRRRRARPGAGDAVGGAPGPGSIRSGA